MIHSLRAGPEGSIVALYRGNHVITAEIVWREGARVGLQAHDRVPVEEILSVDRSATLRLAVAESVTVERRRAPRPVTADEARFRGRAMQFAGVTAAGLCLAIGAAALIEQAFAKPLAAIESALRSQS